MSQQIVIRPFEMTDKGLVFDSWPKGVFGKAVKPIEQPADPWWRKIYEEIHDIMDHHTIRVACLRTDPETILGYAAFKGSELQFIYVKQLFRRQGIGTLLIKDRVQSYNPDYLTQIGQLLLPKLHLGVDA